jgi:hypothetical protein
VRQAFIDDHFLIGGASGRIAAAMRAAADEARAGGAR